MLKKIPVKQLRLGMHLHALCGAWLDHPFWKTKFVLKDPSDLAKLLASGITECWIDPAKGLDVAPAEPAIRVDGALPEPAEQPPTSTDAQADAGADRPGPSDM